MKYTSIFLWVLLIWSPLWISAQNPGTHWMKYKTPESAGWSSDKLQAAQEFSDRIGTSAFMLIYDGKVVAHWGEIERRFMCHSVRKSLLSALYGIHRDAGRVDIDLTLEQLGIDDIKSLSQIEKQATIRDLLKARSGVYHPAAYETAQMKKIRPKRGSHAPNTFWYYNNWDFNTLCAILIQETGTDFFVDFKNRIADPLQMEDFRLMDTYYHLEPKQSTYPAYPFRMSARDLARIGQWFLQEGRWGEKYLVSSDWVKESTSTYSENTRTPGRGYGYLWWTGIYGGKHRNYSAQGVGNQAIIVYPDDNIVMVNRANTYRGERVATNDLIKLTQMVLEARSGESQTNPQFVLLPESQTSTAQTLDSAEIKSLTRTYKWGKRLIKVSEKKGRLVAYAPNMGTFNLKPVSSQEFILEDAEYKLYLTLGKNGKPKKKIRIERRP